MGKYKGKKVHIVGFGKSGVAVAHYLAKQGARLSVTDLKQRPELAEQIQACADLKIEYDLGRHNSKYFLTADLVVVSPGVPLNIRPIQEAQEKNIPIVNEVDLAAGGIKEPIIAVTGTNGKTTISCVLGEIFKADGRAPFVGGNIGDPLVNYFAQKEKKDVVVAELSSFQLELATRLIPAVAIFTNIGQDHMDRYPDMESYVRAKKNLLRLCDRNTYVVLNYDDPEIAKFAQETNAKIMWVTKQNPMKIGGEFAEQFVGAYLSDDQSEIIVKVTNKEESFSLKKLRLFGDHNKENLMAAICAARAMDVKPKAVQQVVDRFPGVPHRLEFVKRLNGVFFINDSKATNVMSVYRSLAAFRKSPIILIAGGKDKDLDFSSLSDLVHRRCKILVLLGEAKEKINRSVGDYAETYLVGTFEEAILVAYQKSRSGDIILLSPGCASYDMFRNYEERGDYFKKLVNQL